MTRADELFEEDLEDLQKVLIDIRNLQKKQASLGWSFWRGVFYGFGVFIGSVILVAAVVYVLTRLNIDNNSVVGQLIDKIVNVMQSK